MTIRETLSNIFRAVAQRIESYFNRGLASKISGAAIQQPVVFSDQNVKGNIFSPNSIVVLREGCEYIGDILAKNVVIEGSFEGTIVCHTLEIFGTIRAKDVQTEKLTIYNDANVYGDISFQCSSLTVITGANIFGTLIPEEVPDRGRYWTPIGEQDASVVGQDDQIPPAQASSGADSDVNEFMQELADFTGREEFAPTQRNPTPVDAMSQQEPALDPKGVSEENP